MREWINLFETENWQKNPHVQFHLSVEPNLKPGRPFSNQVRTVSKSGARGQAGGEGIYTTKNPSYWYSQLAYEEVDEVPRYIYLVWVKEPNEGSVWAPHQNVSNSSDVVVLAKIMDIPDDDAPLETGKLIWLTDKYFTNHPLNEEAKINHPKRIELAKSAGFDTSKIWFHGSGKTFAKFKEPDEKGYNELGIGVYLTDKKFYANTWARSGGKIYECVIKPGPIYDFSKRLTPEVIKRLHDAHSKYIEAKFGLNSAYNDEMFKTHILRKMTTTDPQCKTVFFEYKC